MDIEELKELSLLVKEGVISKDEFNLRKKEVLTSSEKSENIKTENI